MRVLNLTNLPIYLPYDKAPVPFGDPIPGVTATAAAPGVFTAADTYTPANGDVIAFTFPTGGSLPAPLTVTPTAGGAGPAFGTPGQPYALYYVVGASGQTFNVSYTKGGAAITTTTTGANFVVHLMSNEVDGVTLPFKAGATVVVENNTGGALHIQGATDTGVAAPGQGYNPPAGPGAFTVFDVTIPAGGAAEVVLIADWIRVSTAATLILQQN